MRSLTRPRFAPALNLFALGAFVPVGLLWAVGHDSVDLSSEVHFAAVGLAALVAIIASLALTFVGVRASDGPTILVGTAFSAMAGLLLLHGIASPGVLVEMNGVVSLSGGATLPVGAAILTLSLLPGASGVRGVKPLVGVQIALLAGIAVLGTVGLLVPDLVPSVPEPRSALAMAVLVIGLALFALLALRALDTFLLTLRLTDYLVVLGLVFLGTALVGALMFDLHPEGLVARPRLRARGPRARRRRRRRRPAARQAVAPALRRASRGRHEQAIALLREQAGDMFDEQCVGALDRVLERERDVAA